MIGIYPLAQVAIRLSKIGINEKLQTDMVIMDRKNEPDIEVLNISIHGLWLYVRGREYFLPYNEYPWFQDARLSEIHNVQLLHGTHLYWPNLDVDLSVNSLEQPGRYPLKYQ